MGYNDHINLDLHALIQDLVDENLLERGTPAYGIAQKLIMKGTDSLSPKQQALYNSVIIPLLQRRGEELKTLQTAASNPD